MIVESIFLFGVTGISILFGFGRTFAAAKKEDPTIFDKEVALRLQGNALARRALGWGTFYAFTTVGLLTFGIWKCLKVDNLQEFRTKMGNALPRISNPNPQGKTEFKSLTDLLQYIIDEDTRIKSEKVSTPEKKGLGSEDK